jgi:2-polyprenyl-6-hydroxyphenyl methylase/3-demethylubiquinone-9 3-methyltransferase
MTGHATEVSRGNRFKFGANWAKFLEVLDDNRILQAEKSLKQMLEVDALTDKRFLDIGSGSGLFSLAARRLGAKVHSFDYDPQSVACTAELKRRYFPEDPNWVIEEASILDQKYLVPLGQFDVVYAWGILHHTGAMWQALENAAPLVAGGGGKLFIAIYNDQGRSSKYWSLVKRTYNKNKIARIFWVAIHTPYLFGMRWLVRALTGRLSLERGMSLWYNMIDWLGGYPFEVAKPDEIFDFYRHRGFQLDQLKTCAGKLGCNQFVFKRINKPR